MKVKVLALATITAISLSAQVYAAKLSNDTDKLSYTMGYQMGSGFKTQDMKLNPDAVTQGIKDGLAGSKPALSKADQQAVVTRMQKQAMAKAEAKRKVESKKNETAGKAFLAANAKKSGVKTTKTGLQYKVITAGKGKKPAKTDMVKVDYTGKLIDGTVFDSSKKHGGPATFAANQVIPGWTEALQMMPVGSEWQLTIPAKLAYGENGIPGAIPPNATLQFDVKLLSIEKPKVAAPAKK